MNPLRVAGQTFRLFAEKAVHWIERETLFITDPHFGKSAFFRSRGVPVPGGVTDHDLQRLSRLLDQTDAARLVVLGDFFHAKGGRARQTLTSIRTWRRRYGNLEILLVRGNHDRHAGDPPRSWNIRVVDNGYLDPPFAFCHEPHVSDAAYVLAGHLHPAVTLQDVDGTALRLPCFSFGARSALLPSFGSFTGAYTITPRRDDRVFVVGPDDVVEVE